MGKDTDKQELPQSDEQRSGDKPNDDIPGDGVAAQPSQQPSASKAGGADSAKPSSPSGAGSAASSASKPGSDAGKSGGTGKPGVKKTTSTPKPPRTGKKSGGGKKFFLLLVLAAIVAGGYYGWREYGAGLTAQLGMGDDGGATTIGSADRPESNDDAAADHSLQAPAEPAESTESADAGAAPQPGPSPEIAALTERAQEQSERLEALGNQVAEMQLTLNSQRERLRSLSTTTREDWLLAEAEYLLRLANQRLLTERQAANALALMENADHILRDIDDPDLFPVRKSIAADITALRVAGTVDREGLYLQLDALIDLIARLDLPAVEAEKVVAKPSDEEPWYQVLGANALAAVKNLSGIVRVEKLEATAEPRLLPSEQQLLRANLRLALEQAQLALMREEQAIFEASLDRAGELVAGHFSEDDEAAVMLAEIQSVADARIDQELPTVTGSIRALRDYISLWHNSYQAEDAEPADAARRSPTASEDYAVRTAQGGDGL